MSPRLFAAEDLEAGMAAVGRVPCVAAVAGGEKRTFLMKSFRMLTAAALVAAIMPRLAQRGMFVDGLTYASIARNLAEGRGSFWSPSYTATIYPEFHEHPPLGLWLQSLWFRVLGDHLAV